MPSATVPVDWHKVEINNWSQYGATVDDIKIHLNDGNSPSIGFIPSAVGDEKE